MAVWRIPSRGTGRPDDAPSPRSAPSLDEVVAAARRAAADEAAHDKGTRAGHLAGLVAKAPTHLLADPGESAYHHAGYLAGALTRWLAGRGRPLDASIVHVASVYGAALSDAPAQRYLTTASETAHKAHMYAMVRVERHTGVPVPVDDEGLLVSWLFETLRLRPPADFGAYLGRQRRRRHDRVFPDGLPG